MRRELPKHSKYKESGVEWLGRIPAHWDVLSFKRLCKRVDVGIAEAATHAYCVDGVPIIRSTNVRPNRLDTGNIFSIMPWFAEKNRSKYLRTGDLVTVRTGYPGTTAVIPPELDMCQCFTLIISTLRKSESPNFFSYYFNSIPGMTHFIVTGWGSAQINISVPIVQENPVPRPSLEEQRTIVAFLDVETGKIDRLMGVRHRQIDVLREQRAAVIHHAVTQGLDPAAPKIDSGIEWLGRIPEHWVVRRLKYWAKHYSSQVDYLPEGLRYIALENVESKTGRLLLNEDPDTFESNVKLFRANDILFGRLRPYLAKVARPDFDGVCVGELMVIRPGEEVRPDFLQLRLLTPDFIRLVDGSTQGAKMPRANWWFIGNTSLALPPIHEQEALVERIDRETAKIDTLIGKYERELALLEEYRASLISHAVTGKMDVRGLAACENETPMDAYRDTRMAAEEPPRYGKRAER